MKLNVVFVKKDIYIWMPTVVMPQVSLGLGWARWDGTDAAMGYVALITLLFGMIL